MPKDDATQTSVYVLVEGRKVMELEDPDAAPRNWDWLGRVPNQSQFLGAASGSSSSMTLRPSTST